MMETIFLTVSNIFTINFCFLITNKLWNWKKIENENLTEKNLSIVKSCQCIGVLFEQHIYIINWAKYEETLRLKNDAAF